MSSALPQHGAFKYDLFWSYDWDDKAKVETLHDEFEDAGLTSFFAVRDLKDRLGAADFARVIDDALDSSCHLVVYFSAETSRSKYVRAEIDRFVTATAGAPDRRVIVLRDPALDEITFRKWLESHEDLKERLWPETALDAMRFLTSDKLRKLASAVDAVQWDLEQAHQLVQEAFNHYQHSRFWQPFSTKDDLHIFTCGRDNPYETVRGGRTVIDKWDYQAAVDVTHYFARHYRKNVEIEQPVSKMVINEKTFSFDRGDFTRRLEKKTCVIIGSPDVSDFAEVALASLLGTQPYKPGADFPVVGFRIRKDIQTFSTFYEPAGGVLGEGIHLLLPKGREVVYECADDRSYGLMVLADNPYSQKGAADKILILAGHTGVATRAMSLLLTESERWCLDAFYQLDRAIAIMRGPVAAVIEVRYVDNKRAAGDGREIPSEPGMIAFKAAIELKTGKVSLAPSDGDAPEARIH